MKILHICLSSAFTEGMSYQENFLINQNIADGHAVTIITDCHKYHNGTLIKTIPEDKVLSNGVHLIRIKYDRIINTFISGKIRKVSKLFDMIVKEAPNVILYHGVVGWELLSVARYKKEYPSVKLYLDSHEDFNNSGTNIISRVFQYRIFNRSIVKKVTPYIEKILCVSYECFDFIKKMFDTQDELLEYYPLGGIVFDKNERQNKRDKIRKELELGDDDILLIHSGKMDALKRTEELLTAFHKVKSNKLHMILIGAMDITVKDRLEVLISQDHRIKFLGWKSSEELLEYLCACDLYMQPGSQSATLQNALCCGAAAAVFPYESHKYLLEDSVFYIEKFDDIVKIFDAISTDYKILNDKQQKSFSIACKLLDYKVLAKRLYR